MPELLQEPTQAALWQRLVSDAQQRAGHTLDETLESYLVFVLMRYLRENQLGHQAQALAYLQQQDKLPAVRHDGLRDVGDQCLLIAGLFPERARHRRVPVSYYIDLGQGAYRDLSEAMREGIAELYRQLAEAFENLVRVLLAARDVDHRTLEAMSGWVGQRDGAPLH